MSARGLAPQQFAIPLASGLQQKFDTRALEAPGLSVCLDAQFDEVGGIQTRKSYTAKGINIANSGDTVENCRRVVANGNELLLFTKDTLYSWNAQQSEWVSKGTHLAVATTETPRFVTTGDQVECDRAELTGTIVYAWKDDGVWCAAVDKATGSVLMAPTAVTSLSVGGQRPRVVALATKILLFYQDDTLGPDLLVKAIDPADPATSVAAAATNVISSPDFGSAYDVEKIPGADTAILASARSPDTSYTIAKVTAACAVTSSTKARTCNKPIAIACDPTGTSCTVVRRNGTDILGDFITISSLADVTVGQAIGTSASTPTHIAAAYRSTTTGGFYRCYVYWVDGTDGSTAYNWVDTNGALGTEAILVLGLEIGSRAFSYDGSVYLWLNFTTASTFWGGGIGPNFAYALQNTYFLYRDDGFLVAKAAATKAGGSQTAYYLPGVAPTDTGTYSWCGAERRIIDLGGSGRRRGYGARAPRDITFTFDSNEARRTARIGETLYITGGEILQYDGARLTEVGLHVYPHTLALSAAGSGAVEDGTYAVKMTGRWDNARGEIDRSTTATVGDIAVTGPDGITVQWSNLFVTHKTDRPIALEVWRTAKNPTQDAPFYLVTSKDPTDVSGANCYIANDTSAATGTFDDELIDEDITSNETNNENGGLLENLAPPPASIVIASSERLFLAGIAGDPDRVWYSKQRQDGEVAAFHDALTVSVPREGGVITGLGFLNETLVVFKETAIYALPGDGFDNAGGGQNFGPARLLSADVGAQNHEAIAVEPRGLVFQSSKGKYLLGRGWQVEYIGGPVSDYDDESTLAVHVVESQHQIRWCTASRMLVLDYLVGQWSEWSIADMAHAAMWRGAHLYLSSTGTGVFQQGSDWTGADYGLDIETAWIPLGQVQGFGRVWKVLVLGEYRSAHKLRIRIYRNYAAAAVQDKLWTVSPTTVGGPEQVKHGPSIQEMQAIKIRITAVADDAVIVEEGAALDPPTGEALKLTSLALELGIEQGLHRLPAAQRQ